MHENGWFAIDTSSKKLDAKFEELAEDNSDDTATYSNGGLVENFVKKDVEKENAEKIAKQLDEIILTIKVKAGDNGKIFGGVTSKEISEELKKQNNIEVDKKKIVLAENIKKNTSIDRRFI